MSANTAYSGIPKLEAGMPSLDEVLLQAKDLPWREKSLKGVSEKMLWRNDSRYRTESW